MYLRFMITLVMQLQSRCQQCLSLVNVSKIHDYIGNAVAITLPAMFVLTGCDTVSYFYRKSNKTILERVVKKEILAVELLSDFGKHTHLSETAEEKLKRFILIFVYGIYAVMYVLIFYLWLSGNSHQRCSVKKGVLKNFSIFTEKNLRWSLFSKELQAWMPASLLKRDPNTGVTSCTSNHLPVFIIDLWKWKIAVRFYRKVYEMK